MEVARLGGTSRKIHWIGKDSLIDKDITEIVNKERK